MQVPDFFLTPLTPGDEDITSWLQSQFDVFRLEVLEELFVGRRFDPLYVAASDAETFKPRLLQGFFLVGVRGSSAAWGHFFYDLDVPFLTTVSTGTDLTGTKGTASKINVSLTGTRVEIENLTTSGVTVHVAAL